MIVTEDVNPTSLENPLDSEKGEGRALEVWSVHV